MLHNISDIVYFHDEGKFIISKKFEILMLLLF